MWDIALTNYGALTLTGSGAISSSGATNSYAIWQSSGKPFKMNGAKISGKTNETLVHIASGTAEFTGGNIVLENNTENNINGNAIFASGTGSFEITTGSVIQGRNGGSSSLVKSSSASECKITGGYVGKFENTSGSLVYNAGSGTLSISDGKFDMFGLGSGVVNDTGTLNISGGTINLEVKKAGATVWQKGSSAAVANTSSGSVTISGGTINAYSSIGINNYTNGTVELSNVTINNAAPYSGANDIMGATVGATTQKDYTGARGKITIKSGTTIENTNGGIAVYASAYGDVYLYGGYITSKASTWTMYFGHGERFHPSDAISTTISKYVKNTGGGIEYHFALNQDLKKLYFYANNNKYNILDKEKVGV
ncbi:unknown [Clostridium sp. CAG:921]|nr:unknown [Clostridium sp. CAG:921]